MPAICDWRDPKKRTGDPGYRCHVVADFEIVRVLDDKRFTAYRCQWHVPENEPKIGYFEKRALEKPDHVPPVLDSRTDVTTLAYHARHVGDG